ncbi:hypothetical protein [Rubrivirga sp. IMCC43871]|uniref:hypothetical protein n=1 Tax=Rubrivirga sp. IMCC43871 TaxID=3391575 RepID=UPI0039901182
MAPPTLSTWLYAESPDEESLYPQVVGQGAPSSDRFQAVYWRCVAVFFASAKRWAPDARLVLYTNVPAVPAVDGQPMAPFLDRLGVEIVRLDYSFQPPEGYYGAWRNQFYVFDAIRDLAERTPDDGVAMLLDSDCVWARSPDRMAAMTQRHGTLTYDLGRPEGIAENGLTLEDLGALHTELAPDFGADTPDTSPPYIGGELVAATGHALRRADGLLDALWAEMLRRHQAGLPTYNEEAHALGFVYHVLGAPYGTANPYLRRIWTTLLSGDDSRAPDLDLTVWHVPGEKRYGLRRLFVEVLRPDGPFWTLDGDAWRTWAGRQLGLPGRSLAKTARDLPVALRDKLRARLGR